MNERIRELAEQADGVVINKMMTGATQYVFLEKDLEKFAELIVRDCMDISKTWEDHLEKAKLPSEADAVGIVTYRISRQFGVPE